jgi:hypothetical protein
VVQQRGLISDTLKLACLLSTSSVLFDLEEHQNTKMNILSFGEAGVSPVQWLKELTLLACFASRQSKF